MYASAPIQWFTRSPNVYRTISSSFPFVEREIASVVILASSHPALQWAESALPSWAQIACNATPCRQCRQPSRYFPTTSTGLSKAAPTKVCVDPSAGHRTAPDSWHRAGHKLHAFRLLWADRRLPHRGIRNCHEAAPHASLRVLSSLTSFQNADSPSGTP